MRQSAPQLYEKNQEAVEAERQQQHLRWRFGVRGGAGGDGGGWFNAAGLTSFEFLRASKIQMMFSCDGQEEEPLWHSQSQRLFLRLRVLDLRSRRDLFTRYLRQICVLFFLS